MPSLTRREAAQSRSRHAPRGPLALGPARQLRLAEADGQPCGPDPVRITLLWGCETLSLRCPAELAHGALQAMDAKLASLDALPPDLAGLLLEAATLDLVTEWERASGRSVTVMAVRRDEASPADGLAMLLHAGTVRSRVHLECTPAQAAAILASWPVAPRPANRVALPAVLRLGATELTRGLIASLRPDDTVLLQRHQPQLVVAGCWTAAAHRAESGWSLKEAPHPARAHEGESMPTNAHGDAQPVANPDDLPLTLTFEVGRLTVTVGELRRLGPGAVMNLGRGPEELVEIATGGRRVGQGELVNIEGAVGVRIVRLFDAG